MELPSIVVFGVDEHDMENPIDVKGAGKSTPRDEIEWVISLVRTRQIVGELLTELLRRAAKHYL